MLQPEMDRFVAQFSLQLVTVCMKLASNDINIADFHVFGVPQATFLGKYLS